MQLEHDIDIFLLLCSLVDSRLMIFLIAAVCRSVSRRLPQTNKLIYVTHTNMCVLILLFFIYSFISLFGYLKIWNLILKNI
jgi:hypothetical protein